MIKGHVQITRNLNLRTKSFDIQFCIYRLEIWYVEISFLSTLSKFCNISITLRQKIDFQKHVKFFLGHPVYRLCQDHAKFYQGRKN